MQRNVNIATGFKPRTAKGLRFSALMHETHGHVGEYWCEADALEDAKAEAIAAAHQYMGSRFGAGDVIDRISMSEKMPSGETESRGSFEI